MEATHMGAYKCNHLFFLIRTESSQRDQENGKRTNINSIPKNIILNEMKIWHDIEISRISLWMYKKAKQSFWKNFVLKTTIHPKKKVQTLANSFLMIIFYFFICFLK